MFLDNEVPMFASVIAVAEFIWETSQLIGFFASKAIMCVAQDSGFRYLLFFGNIKHWPNLQKCWPKALFSQRYTFPKRSG